MLNRFTPPQKKNIAFLMLIPILLAIFLWIYSDKPPYGYPGNELSNNYWGIIVNIAHKWRATELSFWDKGLQGGESLFTSGQYPLLNPSNILCLILNDNDFYLLKLIEPYFLGVLFMLILLNRQYKLSLPISVFGSFLYMGAIFTRHSIMLESPFFLWGISLFPLMVITMEKYIKKDTYLSAALVGAVIALIFAGEGVIQVPQLIIWWGLFYAIYLCYGLRSKLRFETTPKLLLCITLLSIMSIGLFGIQFIPTIEFVANESISRSGHYIINNFPLWGKYPPMSLEHITRSVIGSPGGVSGFVFGVLFLGTVLAAILQPKKVLHNINNFHNLRGIWLSTILFFILPSLVETITGWLPLTKKPLSLFSTFTFKYGLHILDFCFALTFCVFLDSETATIQDIKKSKKAIYITAVFIGAACFYAFSPVAQWMKGLNMSPSVFFTSLPSLVSKRMIAACIVFITCIISLFYLVIRPRNRTLKLISWASLILLGFMTVITSYNWNDKGRVTDQFGSYCWNCPEHLYFKASKNKHFFSLPHDTPAYMAANYGLLYDVYSTTAFMPLDPRRFVDFQTKFRYNAKSAAAPNYFPIHFTTVQTTNHLNWTDFVLKVKGTDYDIYEHLSEPEKVFFANRLKIVSLPELLHNAFYEPPINTFYVSVDDAQYIAHYKPEYAGNTNTGQTYSNYTEIRPGSVQFHATSSQETYAMVPEMFQSGWLVRIDGSPARIFPANYIFIGFVLPAGEHFIQMTFTPPGLYLGLATSILSVFLLIFLFYRHRKTCP
ncbi:MAG: hypothetical protein A3C36_03500 [Omnitrophica WOR_2 bacterium RIFCSPHIGHO2_02_FULL_52_10]|nr:MAG: hypothetical protein A3C36_03500 [Omnitrophica WOR_2 bacterium RIFCSPHIGHO2_02_FULL_52_10]